MTFDHTQGGTGNYAYKHGLSRHPLYGGWYRMMRRCYDPTQKEYADYGGRGIQVFEEWHDVRAFVTWVESNLGPRPEPGWPEWTLDRIDNDGSYVPGNLRWARRTVQNSNQRRRPQRGYPVGVSGYRGVHPTRTPGRWQAAITVQRRNTVLGTYGSPEEAARAYDRRAWELAGPRARLNFPQEVQ